MTSPKQATTTDDGRYYSHHPDAPGKKFVSVTTVLGFVGKGDALLGWAAKVTSEALERTYNLALKYDKGYSPLHPQAFKDAKAAWRNAREDSANRGSRVHKWIEDYFAGDEYPPDPDIRGHIAQFRKWLEDHKVEPILSEVTLYGDGYAGTCDLIAKVDGILTTIDFKTSKTIQPSMFFQLAAYAAADTGVTDDGKEVELPDTPRLAVLKLRPRSSEYVSIPFQLEYLDAFMAAKSARRYWKEAERIAIEEIDATRP